MKKSTTLLLKKALPVLQKKTTWAIILAPFALFLGMKAETIESVSNLLSLVSTIAGQVL